MNALSELKKVIYPLGIPVETGVFNDKAPDKYIVLVPLVDTFAIMADNMPSYDVQEVRISLYSKNNYIRDKNMLVRSLFGADFTITDRKYIGYENETGYSIKDCLRNIPADQKPETVAIVIGPEGGFAESEIELALANGLQPVTLGKRILRTETAGMFVLSAIGFALEA